MLTTPKRHASYLSGSLFTELRSSYVKLVRRCQGVNKERRIRSRWISDLIFTMPERVMTVNGFTGYDAEQ
jgi:hypothetical protein